MQLKLSIILFGLLFSSTLWARSLSAIKESNVLYILTRNAPTTYFIDKDGNPSGIDYELGRKLAISIGVAPRFVIKDSLDDILTTLRAGVGDVAIAGLSKTVNRKEEFLFSKQYQSIRQQFVCNKRYRIENSKKMGKISIVVAKGTSYIETLEAYKKKVPDISYSTSDTFNTEELLAEVWDGRINCTMADSNIVSVIRRFYPELKILKSFPYEGLSMMFPGLGEELKLEANKLITRLGQEGVLTKLEDRFYGHTEDFDYYDIKVFKKRIKSRLTKFSKIFKKAAKLYDMDWRLLAAVSYQESHWDPKARSPTGVRGMMMLTRATAKEMLVNNRLNVAESIFGGAKYLKHLIGRVPKYINAHDRFWMGVASYNVGYYHMRDARSIAVWLDKNPNFWNDVKDSLPYLSQKKYYKKLPYGHARGREPVLYVKRIRHYYDILKNVFKT